MTMENPKTTIIRMEHPWVIPTSSLCVIKVTIISLYTPGISQLHVTQVTYVSVVTNDTHVN